jgi:hypothetical protein
MKDPLKELEEQSKSLQELKVNEDNQQDTLKSIENLLSSMDEKLELIFKSLTEE